MIRRRPPYRLAEPQEPILLIFACSMECASLAPHPSRAAHSKMNAINAAWEFVLAPTPGGEVRSIWFL